MIAASLDPASLISRGDFASLVQDYLVLGNGYVREVRNRLGG
jgi:capsid portal protein